ncbi:MAG: glutaredoxin 3 [Candidatus Melainabacteria bacterium GWF2_37_15]|nr:MAG: glutaredoxin 3 [Candidatus Melainabacteria bacterium GWF2_37_15]
MAKVVIYTVDYCPYCNKAKKLLKEKCIEFEDHDITANETEGRKQLGEMLGIEGRVSVPQIIINGKHIGGYTDLKALDESGKLDELFNSPTN